MDRALASPEPPAAGGELFAAWLARDRPRVRWSRIISYENRCVGAGLGFIHL
jgi:hypothetical protein